MYSSPVRHSPPIRASSYCAAVRLACVRPAASVHSEPGSNSSLKTTLPEGKNLKLQKFNHWQRIACFKQLICCLIKRLQDGQVILPAGVRTNYLRTLSKNFGAGLSAFPFSPRRFRLSEPPIIAGFLLPSTPRFEAVDAASGPEGFSRSEPAILADFFLSSTPRFRGPDRFSVPARRPFVEASRTS